MKRSAASPALPAWIFIATDLALIGAAAVIAFRTDEPLSAGNVIAVVACVALGAIVGLIPLVARYERQKNETLDERQRAIEGMAQTLAAAAEQISIATASLHEINETAQKNLRQAAQLPQQLQEKVAQLQQQVAAIQLGDVEKIEALAGRLAKAAAELAKQEAAATQQSANAQGHLAKLADGGEAIARAQAAAVAALESKFAELDVRLNAGGRRAAPSAGDARVADSSPRPAELPTSAPTSSGEPAPAPAENAPATPAATSENPAPAAPKRPRKPRVKESSPEPTPQAATDSPTVAALSAGPAAETPPADAATKPSTAPEPIAPPPPVESAASAIATVPVVPPPAVAPVATPAAAEAPTPPAAQPTPAPVSEPSPAPEPAPKKRAPRKPQPNVEPSLDLPLEDAGGAGPGSIERTISSDGATRLIATSYIGIGNRLFIRGEGAGLNWDKGVALQFVSIGKWRWETNDASAPVRFKLYKNDEQECTALGEQVLEPGHLQEMSAQF